MPPQLCYSSPSPLLYLFQLLYPLASLNQICQRNIGIRNIVILLLLPHENQQIGKWETQSSAPEEGRLGGGSLIPDPLQTKADVWQPISTPVPMNHVLLLACFLTLLAV